MHAAPHYTPPTVIPPDPPYGRWRGALVLARNPVEWWPRKLYEGESHSFTRGSRRFLLVTDPALAQAVLLDHAEAFHRSFLTRLTLGPALGDGLLTSDGDLWRAQRRLAAPAFRPQSLAGLLPVINRAADAAADRLARAEGRADASVDGRVDVMAEMVRTTFEIILQATLGPDAGRVDAAAAARDVSVYVETVGNPDILDILGLITWLPRPWKWAGHRAAKRMRAEIAAAVAARRARPSEASSDLLAQLMAGIDPETGEAMGDERLTDNLLTFIAAGHETTALALTWTLFILANLPALQDELAAEATDRLGDGPIDADSLDDLSLHRRVLQEAMRLYPPAPLIVRDVVADVAIGEHQLHPGDHVSIAVYPMQRNRRIWDAPDVFDPDRFLPERAAGRHRFAWLPFGGGPRICIGMGLAMMEAVAVLATLTRRVRFAPPPGGLEVLPVQRITLRPAGGMPLVVTPR